ncbi:hypothetical protein JTB14_016724 [Gonioctena quinquepunctata]|nr:hypothetical protein JTB14_016724 [Gonioctena quinquepunctata]
MDSSIEEFSTPRINTEGEGDGLKNTASHRRVAIPSSRKFGTRVQHDEKLRLKLENALKEAHAREKPKSHSCLGKKAKTVAEITPTKSKVRRRPVKLNPAADGVDDSSSAASSTIATLHATPRPLDGTPTIAAVEASRRCPRDWAVCLVYQRLLVCVWRRHRARLDAVTESCGRQQNQIHQLEVQVDFLKSLRTSECEKRNEAINECQQLKKNRITGKMAISADTGVEKNSRRVVEREENLKLEKCDLKKCSDQLGKLDSHLRKGRGETRFDVKRGYLPAGFDWMGHRFIALGSKNGFFPFKIAG